jgi:uncharacterized protein (TIGR00290 family)
MPRNARPKAFISWSSGKDCAWALHLLRQREDVEVAGLLSVFSAPRDRVAMHDVRRALVRRQAAAARLELLEVDLPAPCPPEIYEAKMAEAVTRMRQLGATQVAFGDLFLEGIRGYREEKLAGSGLTPIFPLWATPTDRLAAEMFEAGLRALVTSVDPKQLDAGFCGRVYEPAFVADLPAGADPCGENGEFHSFCFAGPMFERPIAVKAGNVEERDGYVYADAVPA